ncbi:T9SS type B sorting domain-containing protein [Flavobacterium sp. HSC-61S13]|uniref:T9SS type B sorting domain-containing protein n=1 Tax=Flavobacterium sp. HSC-61S13 TaxID=2910963 RepID=UPI00209DA9B3|nr:T9SS type B sorting domain-containing protein [Flavobacterium sp. HSC-61S13]MCP1997571.1 gliding motility-associated-like protein [Flavobacterium sp. HSC-61S13]
MKQLLFLLMLVFSTSLFASKSVWKSSSKMYEPSYGNALSYYSFVDYFDLVQTTVYNTSTSMLLAAPVNDNCSGAIDLPVNNTFDCTSTVTGTFKDATVTTNIAQPTCNPASKRDVWYKFVATSKIHQLGIEVSGVAIWAIHLAVYDRADCSLIKASAFSCVSLNNITKSTVLNNLVIGRVYYIRLGNTTANDYPFTLCLTTAPPPMRVSASGNQYSVEELVTEVLVKSGCNLVSDIKYQIADGSPKTKQYNALGYFNKNNSIFPFDEGIVLTTNDVNYVEGPYKGNGSSRGANNERWVGDKDINDAINDAGGGAYDRKRVTQLEFDFIPVKDSIKFEYLLASESNYRGCGEMCRQFPGALFAAWLIDTTNGVGENLAKIPGTNDPIGLNKVRDTQKIGSSCASVNPHYYGDHFAQPGDTPTAFQLNPLGAPFDFVASTVAMSSRLVKVVPGRKYHIKLAVMDFCPNVNHSSAVFFNARSFDIGTPELGEDLVIEDGNALCPGDTKVLGTGLDTKDYTIQWTKDGVDLVGENGANLVVREKGTYGARLNYKFVTCDVELKPIRVEYFDEIIIEKVPQNLVQCKAPGATTLFNLEEAIKGVTHFPVEFSFYENQQDAIDDVAAIPPYYSFDNTFFSKTVWVRIQSKASPCFKIFSFTIKTEPCVIGLVPLSPLRICNAPGSTFDLTVYDDIVYHGIPGYKIEYYTSEGNAKIELNPILNPSTFNGGHHDIIWVRVSSIANPAIYAITSFELLREVIPVVKTLVSPLFACVDLFNPQEAIFNLNTKDNEVKLSASGLVVEYYLTQVEAYMGDVTKALPKWNYQSGEKTVWARVYSANSSCFSIASFELRFNITPTLIGPNTYVVCDNLGIADFDLTIIASDQKGLNTTWKHAFFRNYSEAVANINPITIQNNIFSNNKPGGEPVYIRVEDTLGCVTIKAIDLLVKGKPRTQSPSEMVICDDGISGVAFFDLTSKELEFLNGLTASDYHVYYYASNSLAIEGDFDKAIKDPSQYSNLTASTVYIRIEDKQSGCYNIELLHLRMVTLTDVANSVSDYVLCDSKDDTGKMNFVLASKKSELTSSLSLKISFHESLQDAESALRPINENSYINKDAYTQTVYARVEDVKRACYKVVSINLIVNKYPFFDLDLGHTLTVCSTSNTGIGVFNLIEHGKTHIPSFGNFDFNFFDNLDHARDGVNKIVSPEAYSNVTITEPKVWIRIVNKATGCVGIYDFDLKVNRAPIIVGNLPVTVICDNYTDLFDGKAMFDLTMHESNIIPGVVSGHGSSISYYKTQADAEKAENAISSPKNYVNSIPEETIWYRLLDTTTGCSVVGSFNLKVHIGIKLFKPQDLVSCSDVTLGQNFAYFDLTSQEYFIVGGSPIFGTSYAYYESEADALAQTNAIATSNLTTYKNKTAVQSIWVVVTNENGCRSMTIQTLIVYAMPIAAKSVTLSACEATVGTGRADFDLTLSIPDVVQGDTNLDVYFYGTRALAEAGDLGGVIPNKAKFSSQSNVIYVRVENRLALISPKCYVITELKLVVDPLPSIKPLKPLLACLDQVVSHYEFDLSDKNEEILNGRLATDYNITYHREWNDARNNKKPLPYKYTNQFAKFEMIWVRLENKATGCFSVGSLLIQIESKVQAFEPEVTPYCDDNDKEIPVNDGFTSIDLTVYSDEIIGNQIEMDDLIVTYYASMSDYNANIPILTPDDYVNISSPQTIVAVVKNKDKDLYCSALVEFEIVVNKLPEVITDLEGGYLCKDLETGEVTPFLIDSKLDSSLYEFIWQFNGVEIPEAKGSYYEARLAGNYTVSTVSKATGCASVNSATVTLTALAPFSITIDDTTGNRDEISENGKQTIIVNVLDQKTPAGVYEFALNDGSYQNSNVFYDVVAGEHLVWVRDRLTGACAVSKLINVMNYPKFFTPNGDGHNDTWNIKGLSVQPDAKIYIFDRFGKLLKQLSPAGEGWDGTFGGRPVPSTDYWFTVEYNDFQGNRREFKGHFSLKR